MDASRVRSWRTAFLTLRDEAATSTSIPLVLSLLRNFASQSMIIVSAASNLPSREVALDVMLLVELASSVPVANDTADTFVQIFHLIYDISCRKQLELNSNCCIFMFGFIEKVVECLNSYTAKRAPVQLFDLKTTLSGALYILGELVNGAGGNWSLGENSQLVKALLHVVSFLQEHLSTQSHAQVYRDSIISTKTKINKPEKLWEIQCLAFSMLGDALLRGGSSFPNDVWQSTLEVLRIEMNMLASRNTLAEEIIMSKYYASLLRCLHMVLVDRKASLSEHVASFVAALKMFFAYGLARTSLLSCSSASTGTTERGSPNRIFRLEDSTKDGHGHYRPPHLRKKEKMKMQTLNNSGCGSLLPSTTGYVTSDSEQSDNDGQSKIADHYRSSKARTAAIICLQDLAQADPKSLISQWSMILPTNDALRQWSYQPTLMTSLLFDPVMKTRMAAASALATILDGSSSLLLQIAEYKEFPKCSSFTTLSGSIGQIVVQLHSGLLYLVQHEAHSGLLASLFKVIMLLASATPYARMPGKLLPTVITTVHARAQELCSAKNDDTSLVAAAISCLGVAFSISPPSVDVMELLKEEILTGKSGLIASLFQFAAAFMQPISFEALQALKSILHNYPSVISGCWDKISSLVMEVIQVFSCDSSILNSSKGDPGNVSGAGAVKCIVAAIKVLDEFLRAASGFKGMDDHLDDKLFDVFAEFPRRSRVSSAPFFQEINVAKVSEENCILDSAGSSQWNEAVEKHLPLMLLHANASVRAASITCFSGLTSSVFFSFTMEKQRYVLSSIISTALYDKIPSVRSSACRAVGVIACFQQISLKDLEDLVCAVEVNTHDELVSVRITASWALANICYALRCKAGSAEIDHRLTGPNSGLLALLAGCALQLAHDSDKIKANAVRALGNLSRFLDVKGVNNTDLTGHVSHEAKGNHVPRSMNSSCWLEKVVQTFVSCVTTGNVKVQWNVCHALANLFQNETLVLHAMPWAPSVYSILLLLIRDSSNFKIRIHAAAALAVPGEISDYGDSFTDVLQGLVHVLETLNSDQIIMPSSLKYRDALEEQLGSTTMHVLSLASQDDARPIKDFLLKKVLFFEEWFQSLCKSVAPTDYVDNQGESHASARRKATIMRSLRSLIQIYESCNTQNLAEKFRRLEETLS